jgi:nucleoside-diphosphate-sugar epimerase
LTTALVTGGTGFIGSALVRRLVNDGHTVRVLDNQWRGNAERLSDISGEFEFVEGDIRDAGTVEKAVKGVDTVYHLAYVNGTEFFYTKPELVLDVGIKGIVNVIDACIECDVGDLIVASSSEVYQSPPIVPTDETAPLIIPDVLNPRYSYGGGKILTELMAINYGRNHFDRVLIFRPHNVYGPDMGWEHVLPQFVLRMKKLAEESDAPVLKFPIQGTGTEIRSFVYIDDFTDGLLVMADKGKHLGIYHIGTQEEITMAELASRVAQYYGRDIEIVPGKLQVGGTSRRCPDISKLSALGYTPKISLQDGLPRLANWYNSHSEPPNTVKMER